MAVVAVDAAAFQPHAGQLDLLQPAPVVERLAARRQAEREYVPADHLRARRQVEAQPVLGDGAAVDDALCRQPFEPRAGRERRAETKQALREFRARERAAAGRPEVGEDVA